MTDCIFCKIAAKEVPAEVVYEDGKIIAFMDMRPVSLGHLLVVPKAHSNDILEASADDLAAAIDSARRLGGAAMSALGAGGFNIGVNTKPVAGQVVFHTHFHVIPRYSNDGLKNWAHQKQSANLKETRELIRKKLA